MGLHPADVRNGPERRRLQRVQISVPATINCASEFVRVSGVTCNVSAEGVFLWTDAEFVEGIRVEAVLHFPPNTAAGTRLMLWCVGKVVRSKPGTNGRFGLAIYFEDVEITPLAATT